MPAGSLYCHSPRLDMAFSVDRASEEDETSTVKDVRCEFTGAAQAWAIWG